MVSVRRTKIIQIPSKALQNLPTKVKVGLGILLPAMIIACIGWRSYPYDIVRFGRFPRDQPPSLQHPLGTDGFGRDLLGGLLLSIENSIIIAVIVATIGTFAGALIGFISGYYTTFGSIFAFVNDVFIVIPMLPTLILISVFVRTLHITTMALLLSIFSWAWPAKTVRSQTLSLKEREFLYMAKLSGESNIEIVVKHLMPHMAQYMCANFVNAMLWAILTEAGLEILGLGPRNTMTIGLILYWALFNNAIFRDLWWWWLSPVITIILILASTYVTSLGFDEILNPRLRKGG